MSQTPAPFALITGFEWDAGNADKNWRKHGITQTDAEQVFFHQPLLVLEDPRHSRVEPRWHALGKTSQGLLLAIVFTVRKDLLRVISARPMSRKERTRYAQES
jgi:uncharacterized DUF497 family protein